MSEFTQPPLFSDFPSISASEWRHRIEKDLKGKPIERLYWTVPDGFSLAPFYQADTASAASHDTRPGEFPFRRGSVFQSEQAGWQTVQPITAGIKASQTLQEAIDAEVGGILLEGKPAHIEPLLREFPISALALHLRVSHSPHALCQVLRQTCIDRGIPASHLTGTLTWDPMMTAAMAGKSVDSADLATWVEVQKEMADFPHFRILGVDLSQVAEEGGSHSIQLALALSATVEYIDLLHQHAHLSSAQLAPSLHYQFAIGGSFFLELGKFRAFRQLIAQVLKAHGLDDTASLSPFVMARSSQRLLTHYDHHSNLLRHTTQAMSAILGGVEALALDPFDGLQASGATTGARLSRNIQQLLRHESYFDKVIDPAGGAYYVEEVTHQLAIKSWELFQQIESVGGIGAYASSGELRTALAVQSLAAEQEFAKRKRVLIGVNQSPDTNEVHPDLVLPPTDIRLAAPFEALRTRVDAFGKKRGARLQAFIWQFGDVAMRSARGQFSRNLFGSGGFFIQENIFHDDLDLVKTEAQHHQPDVVVICSSDAEYFGTGKELLATLRASLPNATVIIAGKPEGWETLGADGCIFAGMNAYEFLLQLTTKWVEGQ